MIFSENFVEYHIQNIQNNSFSSNVVINNLHEATLFFETSALFKFLKERLFSVLSGFIKTGGKAVEYVPFSFLILLCYSLPETNCHVVLSWENLFVYLCAPSKFTLATTPSLKVTVRLLYMLLLWLEALCEIQLLVVNEKP